MDRHHPGERPVAVDSESSTRCTRNQSSKPDEPPTGDRSHSDTVNRRHGESTTFLPDASSGCLGRVTTLRSPWNDPASTGAIVTDRRPPLARVICTESCLSGGYTHKEWPTSRPRSRPPFPPRTGPCWSQPPGCTTSDTRPQSGTPDSTLDGALYLSAHGWDERLVGLVAHHSGARFVPVERGFAALMNQFAFEDSPTSDALTYADQTVGPYGRSMTVTYRITEAIARHGPDSPNATGRVDRVPYLLAVADRVEKRLAEAGRH